MSDNTFLETPKAEITGMIGTRLLPSIYGILTNLPLTELIIAEVTCVPAWLVAMGITNRESFARNSLTNPFSQSVFTTADGATYTIKSVVSDKM